MEPIFLTLLEVSAASAVVILAVMALSSLINRTYTARWKYWLWMVLAVRLLVPFNPSFESAPARVEVTIPAAPITLPAAAAVPAPSNQIPAGPAVTIGVSEPVTTAPPMTVIELLMLIWLAGTVVFLLWQMGSFLRFRGLVKRWGLPVKGDNAAAVVLRQVEAEFSIGRKIPALVCKEVNSPMMIGFFRPLLILPREDYPARELSYILRHELTHYQRRDIWYKALLLLANAVHWFNPAVWLMVREASRDLEISCDAAVMKNAGMEERREYSETILACVHRETQLRTSLSTHFYGGKKALKERFANILSTKKRRAGVIAFAAVLLCGALIGGLVACKKTEPAETRRELTPEEIARVNAAFVPLVNNDTEVNPLGVYLISYYNTPYDLKLNEFLAYFPTDEVVTDPAEFSALKALEHWPFGADIGLEAMPVPIHRIPAAAVEQKLREGFDIGLDELNYTPSGDLMYLEGYDCFYNTTSDAVWGFFVCEGGYLQGDDIAVLTNERQRLELRRKGERWYFYSFMDAASVGAAGAAHDIPVENWSYIRSFSAPLSGEGALQIVRRDETAARLARAISPLEWLISTAQPPSFDGSHHPLDADTAAKIAFDNTPRLDFGGISFGPDGLVCEAYPDHPITKRLAQLWEEGRVPCDVIYADDAAATLARLFGITDWEHHTVEFYDYFPEEGVYITYGDLVRGIVYPLVLSWEETANGYSCEVVPVNARSNSIDGVEVTQENAAELAQRVPHFVFTFDMTSGEPVVTGFTGGSPTLNLRPGRIFPFMEAPLVTPSVRAVKGTQAELDRWNAAIRDPAIVTLEFNNMHQESMLLPVEQELEILTALWNAQVRLYEGNSDPSTGGGCSVIAYDGEGNPLFEMGYVGDYLGIWLPGDELRYYFDGEGTTLDDLLRSNYGVPFQPEALPQSISLSQETPGGYQLWELRIEDEADIALVADLLSTRRLTPSAPEDAAWPDGNTSIGFEIEYEDHTVTGACNPQDSNDRIDNGDTRLRTFEDGVFYNYPREIGDQLLDILESMGIDLGRGNDQVELPDDHPPINLGATEGQGYQTDRLNELSFGSGWEFFSGLPASSFNHFDLYSEGDEIVLEIAVTDEAAVDAYLAGWTGERWDRVVKTPARVSQATLRRFAEEAQKLDFGPEVEVNDISAGPYLNSDESGMNVWIVMTDFYASREDVERWAELPQQLKTLAREIGIPEDMFHYRAPVYHVPGVNYDS